MTGNQRAAIDRGLDSLDQWMVKQQIRLAQRLQHGIRGPAIATGNDDMNRHLIRTETEIERRA